MIKKLLYALIPVVYLIAFPINPEDFYEKELTQKAEVYATAKNHMQMFLNADPEYSKSYGIASDMTPERLIEFYDSKEYSTYLKQKEFKDVFQMNMIYVLSYRELIVIDQIKEKYSRVLMPGDYFVIFPLQEKFRGLLPPVMVFLYRKNSTGEWKIMQNLAGI